MYDDHCFDRAGKPITIEKFAQLDGDRAYKFLADVNVGSYRIATIWTGMDPYLMSPPRIFESTVFILNTFQAVEQEQFATEAEALAAHAAFVRKYEQRSAAPGSDDRPLGTTLPAQEPQDD